jgi:hypothetical protein
MIKQNAGQRIANLSKRKKANDHPDWNVYYLCSKFGWDYHTLMNQPIPFVLAMMECIHLEIEQTPDTNKSERDNYQKKRMGVRPNGRKQDKN